MNGLLMYLTGFQRSDLTPYTKRGILSNAAVSQIERLDNGDGVDILLPIEKAQAVWELFSSRLLNIAQGSNAFAFIVCTVGIWKSIQDKSLFKLAGTSVLTLAAGFFAVRANKLKEWADRQREMTREIPDL